MKGMRRGDELTLREWDEAWRHYRHLETMRVQYLGFFFTAVLGVLAFAGPRLADHSLREHSALLVSSALIVGLQLLAGCLYLMVTRLNEVLDLYGDKISVLHNWMLENGAAPELAPFHSPPRAPRTWSEHGSVAAAIFGIGLIVFFLGATGILLRAIQVSGSAPVIVACAIADAITIGAGIWVIVGRTPPCLRKAPSAYSSVPS